MKDIKIREELVGRPCLPETQGVLKRCPKCNDIMGENIEGKSICACEVWPRKETINQCDGCSRGLPLKDGIHINPDSNFDMIGCTKGRYIMLYRLFTERKNVSWLKQMIAEYFPAFTIIESTGYWSGQSEKSIIIEIDTNLPSDEHHIKEICSKIKGFNHQNAVLIQRIESKSELR